MSLVYLIRHGQASFGAADYDQLSERGFVQARVLGAALRDRLPRVDAVLTGTMRRHKQTAEACLKELGHTTSAPREHPGFDEYDHQELLERFEPRYADPEQLGADVLGGGAPRRAFQELFTRAVARWTSGEHDADYTEPWPRFRARAREALDDVFRSLGSSEVALVFTSGGPITAIGEDLLRIPDRDAFRISWTLVNCGVTKVLQTSSRGRVISTLNEHAHFEGPRRELITYR